MPATMYKTCVHYRQHYTFDSRKIFRVYCGHCTFSKPKRKAPDAKACENYMPTVPDETAFVSKEYLTKALLEYVFHLELLPEIHDFDNPSNNTTACSRRTTD